MEKTKILDIKNLTVNFQTYGGNVYAVRGVNLELYKGETLGIVGESGCGKSVTSKAITRLLPTNTNIHAESLQFEDKSIESYSEKEFAKLRGSKISMIFQDPMTSLNPTKKVGVQIEESLKKHTKLSKHERKNSAIKMLEAVGIPEANKRYEQYPHQYSGGMRQRAMIALAMIMNPSLLIADEPTTALDVTIQAQILELMKKIQKEFDTSIIMITHNLGVIANIADRIAVMYAGKIVEEGTAKEIFYNPQHPYTLGLLASVPNVNLDRKGDLVSIPGTPPDLFAPPKGCAFAPRCTKCMNICRSCEPPNVALSETSKVSCWLQDERAKEVNRGVQYGK